MVSESQGAGKSEGTPAQGEAALLASHGIERVPADQFHVDGYRYSNLADAVAQSERTRGRAR